MKATFCIRQISVSLAFAALLFIGTMAHSASDTGLDRVLVIVNKDVITARELDERLERTRREFASRKLPLPPPSRLRQQVLDALIIEKLQLAAAKSMNLEPEAQEIDAAIDNIASRNGMDRENFFKKLRAQGMDIAAYKSNIKQQISISRLINNEVRSKIVISEAEIDAYLASPEGQLGGVRYHLSYILIPYQGPDVAARNLTISTAQSLRQRILNGESFAELAKQYSKGPNVSKGGDIGWRSADQLPPPFLKLLEHTKAGEVTDILPGPKAVHLLRLNKIEGRSNNSVIIQSHALHILIQPSVIRTPVQARDHIRRLRTQLHAGADFATLARTHSDDSGSASKGGDLGWVSPGQMVPEFEQAMNKLDPGQISPVIQTRYGLHLIKLIARRNLDTGNEQRRMLARKILLERKTQQKMEQWILGLRDSAYIEIVGTK